MTTTPYEPNPAKAISDCRGDINKLAMECEIAKSSLAFALIHIEALLGEFDLLDSVCLETIEKASTFLNAAKFKNGEVL